jgi:hypothetical protein
LVKLVADFILPAFTGRQRAAESPAAAPAATAAAAAGLDEDQPLLAFADAHGELVPWTEAGSAPPPALGSEVDPALCSTGPEPGRYWEFQEGDVVAVQRSDGKMRAGRLMGRLPRISAAGKPCSPVVVAVEEAEDGKLRERYYLDTRELHRVSGVARPAGRVPAA